MTTDYKVTELFCIIDEFCKHFDAENAGKLLEEAQPTNPVGGGLSTLTQKPLLNDT